MTIKLTKLGYLFPGKKFRDLNIEEKRLWYRTWYKKDSSANRKAHAKHQRKLMDEFFDHYGRVCNCCGEHREAFLTIEHLRGDGAEHRRQNPGGRGRIIRDIRLRGWPNDYTTLCMNCNFSKFRKGVCPHVVEKAHQWLAEIQLCQKEINGRTVTNS